VACHCPSVKMCDINVSDSCLMVGVSQWGMKTCQKVQPEYNAHSWEGLKPKFKRPEEVNGTGTHSDSVS